MPPNNTNIPNNSTGQPTPNVPPQVVQPSVPAQPAPTVIQPSAAVTPPPVADTASAQPAVTVVASQPAASQSVFTAASDRPKGRWRRKLAIIGIVTGIVAILGCGAAFAYFGFYLPQQPDYVLKTAIKNSLSQHQFTAKGLIKATDSSSGAKSAVDVNVALQSDLVNHASDVQLGVTAEGVTLNGEARSVGGNLYVKVGDLGAFKTIAQAASPQLGSYIDAVNKVVGNQWIVIDDTLLRSANLDCLSQFPDVLSPQDINQIMTTYQNSSFATVNKVTKSIASYTYDFTVDAKKADGFTNSLGSLPMVKRIQACLDKGQTTTDQPTNSASNAFDTEINPSKITDNGKVNVTLVVDRKSKLVSAFDIAPVSTDGSSTTVHFDVNYSGVNITKPDSTKSLPEVFASLQTVISNVLTNSTSQLNVPIIKDAEREADINVLHTQLEAYYAQHKEYPTLAQMNDENWRKANMPSLDKEVLRDPDSTTYLLVDRQTTDAYAYQPNSLGPPKQNTSTSPNAPCDNKVKICVAYTLTAVHSDGTPYTQSSSSTSVGN